MNNHPEKFWFLYFIKISEVIKFGQVFGTALKVVKDDIDKSCRKSKILPMVYDNILPFSQTQLDNTNSTKKFDIRLFSCFLWMRYLTACHKMVHQEFVVEKYKF